MARQRDYAAEYARRKELHPGDVGAARGHRATPEHPERAFAQPERYLPYLQRFSRPLRPEEERALAKANDRRMQEGKAILVIGPPGDLAPGQRQETVEDLAEAERMTAGIPVNYKRIYVWSGGFSVEVDRRESRSRRRAA